MKLFFFAGERSGDLHGSHLLKALKTMHPSVVAGGVAGPKMRAEGCSGILKMEDFEVMGVTDVLKSLPKLWRQFRVIKEHILDVQPDGVVLIDYPGFNLRLSEALRKAGFLGKIVQYVSPTVWAHGKERIGQMERNLDLLLSIYPFEKNFFSESRLPVHYVGNPLGEYVSNYVYDEQWKSKLGIPEDKELIAIFPGSRQGEIKRNLNYQLEAIRQIKKQHPDVCFAISTVNFKLEDVGVDLIPVPPEYTYELMRDSRCALAKSGTVTLELALHGCPTVVCYHLSRLNRLYAKYVLKLNLPHYCIVNILAGKTVFPEFIEQKISTEGMSDRLQELFLSSETREKCLASCLNIKNQLCEHYPSQQAALSIQELLLR